MGLLLLLVFRNLLDHSCLDFRVVVSVKSLLGTKQLFVTATAVDSRVPFDFLQELVQQLPLATILVKLVLVAIWLFALVPFESRDLCREVRLEVQAIVLVKHPLEMIWSIVVAVVDSWTVLDFQAIASVKHLWLSAPLASLVDPPRNSTAVSVMM